MKSRLFFNTKPSQRSIRVIDGYTSISNRIELLTVELRVLNSWLLSLPDMIKKDQATLPDTEKLEDAVNLYSKAADKLTEEIVCNATALDTLSKTILFINKYGK